MKTIVLIISGIALLSSAIQDDNTQVTHEITSYITDIEEPGPNCGDDIHPTCGRELTCLDGAIVKCDNAPIGTCSYKKGACFNGKHTIIGYVKCGEDREECNLCTRCCIGT